jgi:RNA polymerase sigma-70 factor (ECF subfamily)
MYLKNIPDAEDAVQNIFLKLIYGNYRFENLEHERAWLILTSQNHCKNILKHWWRKKRVDIDNIPEPSYERKNTFDDIWKQILLLPNKYKIVIYLYYYEGYSTEEISEILNIKSPTIRSQLSTARKKLKIILEEDIE